MNPSSPSDLLGVSCFLQSRDLSAHFAQLALLPLQLGVEGLNRRERDTIRIYC